MVQRELEHYVFGRELLYVTHPDSLESIVTAEVQYAEYNENATYDFSAIVIRYAKVFENESYYFLCQIFETLMGYDETLEIICYEVQGRSYKLIDYLTHKPNMGTNKYLLSNPKIYKAYKECFSDYTKHRELLMLLTYKLKDAVRTIQTIRNEASHGGSISKIEC